jgi:hypothetical protein
VCTLKQQICAEFESSISALTAKLSAKQQQSGNHPCYIHGLILYCVFNAALYCEQYATTTACALHCALDLCVHMASSLHRKHGTLLMPQSKLADHATKLLTCAVTILQIIQ